MSEGKRYTLTDLTAEEMIIIGQGRYKMSLRRKAITVGLPFVVGCAGAFLTIVNKSKIPVAIGAAMLAIAFALFYMTYVQQIRRSGADFLKEHKNG